MPLVKFTSALKRFFPTLEETQINAEDVHSLLGELEKNHPGISAYLVDETGLRKHVNIFIDGELVRDRKELKDSIEDVKEVHIIQALSGG